MGFSFRRSIKVLPGIRLNLSRSGISTSIGVRGAHVTIGHGKVRETVGIPGTGISYTQMQGTHQEAHSEAQRQTSPDALPKGKAWRGWLWLAIIVAILIAFALAAAGCGELRAPFSIKGFTIGMPEAEAEATSEKFSLLGCGLLLYNSSSAWKSAGLYIRL